MPGPPGVFCKVVNGSVNKGNTMSTIREVIRPVSPEEAVRAYAGSSGTVLYISGGTILVHAGAEIDTAVDLCAIGARGVSTEPDGTVVIGACTPIADLARSGEAEAVAGGILSRAAGRVANHTIRNLATVGGNLVAWHFPTDMPPVLLALDALLRVQTSEGAKDVALDAFYTRRREVFRRGDLIIDVRVPPSSRLMGVFHKVGRKRLDVAIASAAAIVGELEGGMPDVRLALGGLGVAPLRARDAEAYLVENGLDAVTVRRAAGIAVDVAGPRGDRRATADYRHAAAVAAAVRALTEAAGLEG